MRGFSVRVFEDLESASKEAAELFCNLSEQNASMKKRCIVALSGGSTPKRLYKLLGTEPYVSKIAWRFIHFFWADERCVPPEHADSNFRLAFKTFLSKIPLPDKNIHRIRGEGEAFKVAMEYEKEIRSWFGAKTLPAFDLILLGIGEDGHTASLFPGNEVLEEKTRLVSVVKDKKQQPQRITLTLPLINNALNIIFLVSGESKARIARRVIDEKDSLLPASLVRPEKGKMFFLLDKEAGRYLDREYRKNQPAN